MYRVLIAICVIAGCQPTSSPDLSSLTVDQLRIKTSDADPAVRWKTVFEHGRRHHQAAAAIKEITVCLDDDHVEVRHVSTHAMCAVFMHSELPYDQELQAAIDALKANTDPDETVQAGIRIALAMVAAKQQ
jgi:HEAT repeat protein